MCDDINQFVLEDKKETYIVFPFRAPDRRSTAAAASTACVADGYSSGSGLGWAATGAPIRGIRQEVHHVKGGRFGHAVWTGYQL